jgi:hypothetical protein
VHALKLHPVHYGGKDIHRFAPSHDSVLSAHDFKTPKELAMKIRSLMSNEKEYKRMVAWKTNGTSASFNVIAGM